LNVRVGQDVAERDARLFGRGGDFALGVLHARNQPPSWRPG
jgi:hypothetical protein